MITRDSPAVALICSARLTLLADRVKQLIHFLVSKHLFQRFTQFAPPVGDLRNRAGTLQA
jgi:hypothetical protein